MTQTHTPGPWVVEGNMIRQPMLSKRRRIICPPDHDGIQDAAFIVRACNAHEGLVRALKTLLERATALDQSATHEGLTNCEAIAKASAAIAKAEEGRPSHG